MRARTVVFGAVALIAMAGVVIYTQGPRSPLDSGALAQKFPAVGDVVQSAGRIADSAGGVLAWVRGLWATKHAAAQGRPQRGRGPRVVSVEVTKVVNKKTPLVVEALGTVTPIASVVIKPRVDSVITAVHFADGATVKQGDLLFTLDSRAIEAQIHQAEGLVARDKAQLAGAERDVRRYTDLVAKAATPVTNLDNAKTQADTFRAQMQADQASLDNLKVTLSYCTIRAPISGRISAASLKVGNYVRAGSDTVQLATINQMAPIYVSFAVPQKDLPEVRQALAAGTASVTVLIPGQDKHAFGRVTMIDNTVDPSTGMVNIRATMPNTDSLLWPGTLVTTDLTLRTENVVVVPSKAVQVGQNGNYVFVIRNGRSYLQPVTVARNYQFESVISKGLAPGETVVTDGQLLLGNGVKVVIRHPKAGA